MNKVVNRSDGARPESEDTEVTPEPPADPTMAGPEAGNLNTASAPDGASKMTSKLITLAVKTVKEHNENLRPYAELIKREKGANKEKEMSRVKDLKDKMIKSMIDFISEQKKRLVKSTLDFLGTKRQGNKEPHYPKLNKKTKTKIVISKTD